MTLLPIPKESVISGEFGTLALKRVLMPKPLWSPCNNNFQDQVPPLPDSGETRVRAPYPSDDEDSGQVNVAWRGPAAATEIYSYFAHIALMEYLTESAVSPLQADFVEIDDPLASA